MRTVFCVAVAVCCAAGLSGCETGDTGQFTTDQIVGNFSVNVTAGAIQAQGSFWKAGTTVSLVLTEGDTLSVNVAALPRINGIAFDYYGAEVPEAERYVFVFTRRDGTSLVSSVEHLPALQLTTPTEGAGISRAADISLFWTDPLGGAAQVSVSGEHIEGFSEEVADTGAYVVPANSLVLNADAPSTSVAGCVSVSRSRNGTMAEGLKGGITAFAGDEIRFVSAP